MRSLGFFFFLLLLGGFALVALMGRDGAPDSAPDSIGMITSTWEVVDVEGVPASTRQTLQFEGTESLSGDSGCNLFGGSYRWSADEFRIGQLRSTRKACVPEVMAAEETLFNALGRVVRIDISRRNLRLLDADGNTLVSLVESGDPD